MEILKKENIFLNCTPKPKEEIIKEIGALFLKDGYIMEEYIQGMLDKEVVFNTNIGNELAIPHGIEEAKKYVLHSGLCIMMFPEGTDWDSDEKVKIVIGIAGKGDDHVSILGKIAMELSEPEEVQKMVESDIDTIYKMFKED